MATNTTNTEKTMIETAATNMIGLATSANDYVLNTAEQVFDASFDITNKSLDLTSKILKRGLEISATQQEFAFDVLNGIKKKIFRN